MKYLSFLLVALSPTAPAADGAVGLGVLERGVSLWHVRSEARTMWGVELERLRAIQERIEFDTYSREIEEDQLSGEGFVDAQEADDRKQKDCVVWIPVCFFQWG